MHNFWKIQLSTRGLFIYYYTVWVSWSKAKKEHPELLGHKQLSFSTFLHQRFHKIDWFVFRSCENTCKMSICVLPLLKTGVPKLSLAVYPFSISVDEHVPLKMGAGRIFFRQGPKVGFPGTMVQEVGVQGWKRTPKSFDLLKSGQKWRPTLFEFKKWCPTCAEKHMNPFLEATPKRVLYGRKFVSKSHTKLFGQVWGTSGKNPSHAQKFACSYTYVQGLPKNIFARGLKVAKFHFHHSKLRKQLFCKKFDGKMSNFKTLGVLPSSQTPMPLKLFITKTLRKITKIYLLISI